LKPQDFKDLTDEELHDVKIEGIVGSNYWEWATVEEQRRERQKKKVSPWPHPITLFLTSLAVIISSLAFYFNFIRPRSDKNQDIDKVAQRAYLNYQAAVTNPEEAAKAIKADKDFLLRYQVTVTNGGNTPADSILPKINVVVDPDWTPIMITFPVEEAF